jgi:hypothetical protein
VKGDAPVKKMQLWAGLLILFLSGVLIGSLGSWVIMDRTTREVQVRPRPVVEKVMKKLTRDLDLSDQQKERVEEIVCRAYGDLTEIRNRSRPEKEEIFHRSIAEMKAELSTEQQEKLDDLLERVEKRRKSRRGGDEEGRGRGANPCDRNGPDSAPAEK